jgi:hypothetical protein
MNQHNRTIVLNATGTQLNTLGSDRFYVNPIRQNSGGASLNQLTWDSTSGEVYLNTSKTFVINHPVDTEKYIVHACLEGPEAGVYYRGTSKIDDKYTLVKLPEYVDKIAVEFTVFVNAIGDFDNEITTIPQLQTSKVKNNCFKVWATTL